MCGDEISKHELNWPREGVRIQRRIPVMLRRVVLHLQKRFISIMQKQKRNPDKDLGQSNCNDNNETRRRLSDILPTCGFIPCPLVVKFYCCPLWDPGIRHSNLFMTSASCFLLFTFPALPGVGTAKPPLSFGSSHAEMLILHGRPNAWMSFIRNKLCSKMFYL